MTDHNYLSQNKRAPISVAELRRSLANYFRSHSGFSSSLRSVLVYACLSDRPPRTMKALTAKAKLSRSTLWRHWREGSADHMCELPELLKLIAVLRDLEDEFDERASRSRKTAETRAQAVKIFGVFPLDEAETIRLGLDWLRERGLA